MVDDYTLLTPENVELRYDVAGTGSRLIAAMIDYLIVGVGLSALSAAAVLLGNRLTETIPGFTGRVFDYTVIAVAVLILFAGWWGYFVLFELIWNGQSPGKRLLGLRVVRSGGLPVNAIASLIRNVMRAIDLLSLLGVAVMLIDGSSRRLGDFAAGTLVVREPRALGKSALTGLVLPETSEALVESLPNVGRLTRAQYTLLRDFFARRGQLPAARAEALAQQLAADLAARLEMPENEIGEPTALLAAAIKAYEARRQYHEEANPAEV